MLETLWPYLLSAFVGGSLVLIGEYLIICWLERPAVTKKRDVPHPSNVSIPKDLLDEILRTPVTDSTEAALNIMLQFIFQQSTADTRWLRMKFAKELHELLLKAPGKLFESLRLNTLDLGTEFPTMRNIKLVQCVAEKGSRRLQSLDLLCDVVYDGNFSAEVTAVLLLGRSANIHVSVKSVHGKVRLMFRRYPYTHWAVAFEEPPDMELAVHGSFQGRAIRQRIAAIVSSQIHRAVLQKHTLPFYKIRYKPFFPKKIPEDIDNEQLVKEPPCGTLSVYIIEVSRLYIPSNETKIRVMVSLDSYAWVSNKDGELVFDVKIQIKFFHALGIVCRQASGNTVIVDTVVPMTPAYDADVRRGDIIVAIDGKVITNVTQIGKCCRAMETKEISLRVKRPKVPVLFQKESTPEGVNIVQQELLVPEPKKTKSFSFRRVSEVMEGVRLQGSRVQNRILHTDAPQSTKNTSESAEKEDPPHVSTAKSPENCPAASRRRRCSVEKASSDSSPGSTPSTSGQSTPQRVQRHPSTCLLSAKSMDDEWVYRKCFSESCTNAACKPNIEIFQTNSTDLLKIQPLIPIKHSFLFILNKNQKYLNVNVWGRVEDESEETLLGFLNIPLSAILTECKDVIYGQHMRRYSLSPPEVNIPFRKTHPLSSHNGFDANLCYGDVLLWCCWEGKSVPVHRHLSHPSQYDFGDLKPRREDRKGDTAKIDRTESRHDFIRTHFNRSTLCDFCNKKIWLKDAMQCKACGLCCHKKCMIKCQESEPCKIVEKASHGTETSILLCPELITTGADSVDDPDSDEELLRVLPGVDEALDESNLSPMQTLVAGLRRVSSTHSLSAPKNNSSHARSLPPSPSHSPRKQSMCTNPFAGAGEAWRSGGVAAILPAIEAADLPAEALLAAARDSATDLTTVLTLEQIHEMLSAVREEMSDGNNTSEEPRSLALTALMLHCCAAAQIAEQNANPTSNDAID